MKRSRTATLRSEGVRKRRHHFGSADGTRVLEGGDEGVTISADGGAHTWQPYALPFSQPYHIGLDDPATGIPIKLVAYLELGGETNPNPALSGLERGQVRLVFDNSPQLPFSDLKLVLSGGPRALFVSPQTCGGAGASSEIMGWNGAVATPSSNVRSCSLTRGPLSAARSR